MKMDGMVMDKTLTLDNFWTWTPIYKIQTV